MVLAALGTRTDYLTSAAAFLPGKLANRILARAAP